MGATPRARTAAAIVCIALVMCAGLVPAVAATLGTAIFVALWLVLPAVVSVVVRRRARRCHDQPVSLLAVLDSRAPPLFTVLA